MKARQKLAAQEQAFLSWFEGELRKRLAEEHIALEESLFSGGELCEKAEAFGLDGNLVRFGEMWERIGGPQLSAKIIREWRKAHPDNSGPSELRIKQPNAAWRKISQNW